MSDWINDFVTLTEGLWSPPIFRRWAAIATIAGVLQRRVWTEIQTGICYPSLYIALAGGPTSGKTLAVVEARKLWRSVPGLKIGPDNPTKASLTKRLSMSVRSYVNGKEEPMTFSSLAVPVEEFGNFITKYDNEFLAMLTAIWDNPLQYDAPRASAESFVLDKPNMTILAGVTPDTLGITFPELAWGQGFASRLVFIYGEKPDVNADQLFDKRVELETTGLSESLAAMFDIAGEAIWTPEAMDGFISWFKNGMPPVPDHHRLKYYNGRRFPTMIKLSMISAVSAHRGLNVTCEDFNRAKSWLLEAEQTMPDVFRAMGQKSDIEEIAGLHFHIHRLWRGRELANRIGVEDEIIWLYLGERVQSPRIPQIIETAERGGWIRRDMSTGKLRWIPRPLNEVNTKLG